MSGITLNPGEVYGLVPRSSASSARPQSFLDRIVAGPCASLTIGIDGKAVDTEYDEPWHSTYTGPRLNWCLANCKMPIAVQLDFGVSIATGKPTLFLHVAFSAQADEAAYRAVEKSL